MKFLAACAIFSAISTAMVLLLKLYRIFLQRRLLQLLPCYPAHNSIRVTITRKAAVVSALTLATASSTVHA